MPIHGCIPPQDRGLTQVLVTVISLPRRTKGVVKGMTRTGLLQRLWQGLGHLGSLCQSIASLWLRCRLQWRVFPGCISRVRLICLMHEGL